MKGKELGEKFSHLVNVMGNEEEQKAFISVLANDHPTLQQGAMRVFLLFVEAMAKKPYADARNQASVDLAKKIMALPIEDRALPFI